MYKKRVYLDTASAAPVTGRALRAYMKALRAYGNPNAAHTEGKDAQAMLEDARTRIARVLGVKSDAVIFTSGTTESNNMAITGVVRSAKAQGMSRPRIVLIEGMHPSTARVVEALEKEGVEVEAIPYTNGEIDMASLTHALTKDTVLVCVEAVQSHTGACTKARDVRRVLEKHAPHTLLLVDVSQASFFDSLDRTHHGADILTFDAQKIGGVRGIGVLALSSRVTLAPLMHGGGQERGLRPGTQSPALAQAFAVALHDAQTYKETFARSAKQMRARAISLLSDVSECYVNEGKHQAPHILNISLIGRDTDYLVALLDASGFSVSTKSACDTDEEGSEGVYALTHDKERARHTLRLSWNRDVRPRDLERCIYTLKKHIRFLDQHRLS